MTDIVERAAKALEGVTPGPWYTLVDEVSAQVQGFPILDSEKYEIVGTEGFYGDYDKDWANARFIAEARELVPELVAEIERLRARVAELEDRDAAFERVWAVVRDWDISTEPGELRIYEGINGDHVRAIVRAAIIDKEAGE